MKTSKLEMLLVVGTGALSLWFGSIAHNGVKQDALRSAKDIPDGPKGTARSAREKCLPLSTEANREVSQGNSQPGADREEVDPTSETAVTVASFIKDLYEAVEKSDVAAVQDLWSRLPRNAECIKSLGELVTAQTSSSDLRRSAAEALVRIGTRESVSFVLDQALEAQQSGDSSRVETLLNSLDSPMTPEGAQSAFDLLLGNGRYTDYRNSLPDEFAAAARKSLRNAPDRESQGELPRQLLLSRFPQTAEFAV